MAMWLFRTKKIIHTPTQRSRNLRGLGFKLYHLMKLLFCLVLSLCIFFSGILPCGNVVDVLAVDDKDLTEIPLTKITIGGSEFQYNKDNEYDVPFGQNNLLLCYLKEPSLFELPYVVDLEFELTAAQFNRVRNWTYFAPRSIKADGSYSSSTASTWMEVNIRYNYVDGTSGNENLYEYNYDTGTDGKPDVMRTTYDNCNGQVVTVNYHIKAYYTNRVGQLGYGVFFRFAGFTNAEEYIKVSVKTDGAEMQQLKTIAKNTQDTATGITGILEFLPNMVTSIGEFFTNLINTIVQKFSDLIDDITDLFSDLTSSLSGFFSNLTSAISGFFNSLKNKLAELFTNITSAISGFFDNLIQNLVDLFNAITEAIGGFFEDLLNGIKEFFKWLFIPTTDDIKQMIEDFDDFWGNSILVYPLEMFTKFNTALHAFDFSNVHSTSFELPRWYVQISGSNFKIWDNQTIYLVPSGGHIDYFLTHNFSSSTYPYINANSARYGLFLVFWLMCIFKCIKGVCLMLGVGEFIFNPVADEMTSSYYEDEDGNIVLETPSGVYYNADATSYH